MSDPSSRDRDEAPLNPALKSRTDQTHDTRRVTPSPFDSASAKTGQGESWSLIWLVVTLLCVILALYLIF